MVAVHDTYAAQLSSLTRGHAIYHPHPGWDEVRLTRKDAVHIGDVGYMFMGGFQRLFNIHLLHDDPAQSPALPEYFCPLQQYSVFTSVSSPQTFCSRSIHALTVTGQVSGPMFGSGDVSFSTSTECGAILATPDCIRSRDVCNRIHYEEYMLEHVERWHALTSRMGIPARLEDLMLVTGVDLTKSWSTAVFTERQMEGSLGLGIDYTTVGGVRLAARFRWRNTQGAQVNWGPQPEHDYLGDDNWAMRSESGDGQPSSSLRPVNQKEDQAIFIRRLRVKKRSIFRGLKIEANAEPRDLDGDDPDPCTSPCLAIERGPEHEEYSDALTPILDSILGNSGAEIAIAHDDDLPGFLELISRNDVSWPEAAFCQLIGTRTVGKIRSARDDSGCSVISACDTTDPASDSTDLSSTTGAALNDLESSAIRVNNKISRRRVSFRNKKPGRSTQTNSYLTAQLQQKDVLITYLKAQLPHNVGVGRYPSRTSTRRRAASYVFPRLAGSWPCSDIEIEPSALSVPHVLFYGVVSTKEVKPLFHLFFERINPSIAIFDPSLHTPASTHECSPLLFTAICAVALRYVGHPARHQAAMMVAERAIASTFILGVNTVWDCQARALVGAYSMSTRGFKKDSAWMFFDLASNLANSCKLYKISATTSIDSASTSTWKAREALNGKRTWAFCFHLARVMATLAKKPVVTRNESTAVEDAGWYSGSIANGPYDVYLAASTSIMDTIASFYSEMVSIEKGTMQMQSRGTSLRLYATALSYNDKITSTESIWNQRFLSGLVLAGSRLYIFAMSFPKMFRLDEQIGIDLLDKGVFTAFDVIGSIAQMESQSDYLRFAPDEVFLFGTFAADFLLEALLPKYQKFIEQERRSSICLAVKLLIDTLNSPRLDLGWQHSPKLHAIRLEQSSIFYRNLLLQKSAPTFTVDARTAPPAPS